MSVYETTKPLEARPEPQIVQTARDDESRLVCPDCGTRIGASRGGHDLPDGRRVHGWACEDCENVFPGTCLGPNAPGWTDRITGVFVTFRDGTERWVAAIGDDTEVTA